MGLTMGAISALKTQFIDKPKQDAVNQANANAAAAQTQFSPYTNMGHGNYTATADPSSLGSGIQGAMLGAQMGQNMGAAASQAALMKAQAGMYSSMTPTSYVPSMSGQSSQNLYNYTPSALGSGQAVG